MKVLLLAGGDSSEREVSLNSGRAVFDALRSLSHELVVIDPQTGRSLLTIDGTMPAPSSDTPSDSVSSGIMTLAERLDDVDVCDIDVAFIALHGGAGENGSIQNLLELAGVRYTGSNMAACAISIAAPNTSPVTPPSIRTAAPAISSAAAAATSTSGRPATPKTATELASTIIVASGPAIGHSPPRSV